MFNDKKGIYAISNALISIAIFSLIYTYFYYTTFQLPTGAAASWGVAMLLSMTAVLAGLLIELSRFWGQIIEYSLNTDLLILQGGPAAILSMIPAPVWLQAGGKIFPYTFFTDPVVTGIAGVWLGIILFRSLFSIKSADSPESETNQEPDKNFTTKE